MMPTQSIPGTRWPFPDSFGRRETSTVLLRVAMWDDHEIRGIRPTVPEVALSPEECYGATTHCCDMSRIIEVGFGIVRDQNIESRHYDCAAESLDSLASLASMHNDAE